jgi:hypothetical protein
MFRRESEFKIVNELGESIEGEPKSELEQLQAKWYAALEEGYQTKLLKILKLKQEERERLFYILSQHYNVRPLRTVLFARCLRDDLQVFDVQVTYTTVPYTGGTQEATFKLIPDPKAVGIDPTETAKLVHRTIKGQT